MNNILTSILMLPVWLSSFSAFFNTDSTVVHAVLFYSPNCGHCHLVITEALPPLFEQYGEQLSIVGVDVTQPGGQTLFLAALQHFNLESSGVPLLVIGDTYLVGSVDIPEKFPGLIERYLAQGGVDWPAIPGLAEAISTPQATDNPIASSSQGETSPTATAMTTPDTPIPTTMVSGMTASPVLTSTPGLMMSTGDHSDGLAARFGRDPQGNSLAVIVLIVMIFSIVGAVIFFRRAVGSHTKRNQIHPSWDWLIPVLCVVGLTVAGYLAYVETAQVEAVCGPVGDCNTVQQSSYARLFGVLPIGVFGMLGYGIVLLTWAVGRSARRRMAAFPRFALLGFTSFGLIFSIYLPFLEPFVIGATCAWCLTSAIIMTALFWLSLAPARAAFSELFRRGGYAPKLTKPHRTG
jgi:uncharacterized membrane protein